MRLLKVYTAYRRLVCGGKFIPQIRLQGDWLLKAGFSPDDPIEVKVSNQQIIIKRK